MSKLLDTNKLKIRLAEYKAKPIKILRDVILIAIVLAIYYFGTKFLQSKSNAELLPYMLTLAFIWIGYKIFGAVRLYRRYNRKKRVHLKAIRNMYGRVE